MKFYCPICYQPTESSNAKPKFCMACGGKFDAVANVTQATTPKQEIKPKPPLKITLVDDDENDQIDSSLLNNFKLDYQMDVRQNRGVKIENIACTQPNVEQVRDIPKGKKMSKKAILEQFSREAGSGPRESQEIQ